MDPELLALLQQLTAARGGGGFARPTPGAPGAPRPVAPQTQIQPTGPTGIAGFLGRPGISDALLATGGALLAQADQPGSIGGALGRALPSGVSAFRQGQQRADFEGLLEGVQDPNIRQIIGLLGPQQGAQALAQLALAPSDIREVDGALVKVDPDDTVRTIREAAPPDAKIETRPLADGRIGTFVDGVLESISGPADDTSDEAGDRTFNRENTLADDFRTESRDSVAFARAINQARQASDNAIGDQTLIFSMNNLLDPGVSVRQDDFVRYAEAGGLEARAERFWNMIGNDGRLPANVLIELKAEIESLATDKRQAHQDTVTRFTRRATEAGVKPENVVFDPFRDVPVGGSNQPGEPIDFFEMFPFLRRPGN